MSFLVLTLVWVQLQDPLVAEEYKHENQADTANDVDHRMRPEIAKSEAVLDNVTPSSISAFQESPEIPVSKSVLTHLNNCREVVISLAESGRKYSRNSQDLRVEDESSKAHKLSNLSDRKNKTISTPQVHGSHRFDPRDPVVKGFAGVAAQKSASPVASYIYRIGDNVPSHRLCAVYEVAWKDCRSHQPVV